MSLRGHSLLSSTFADYQDCPAVTLPTAAPIDPTTVTDVSTTPSNETATIASDLDGGYCGTLVQERIAQAKAASATTTAYETTAIADEATTMKAEMSTLGVPDETTQPTVNAMPSTGLPAWAIALVVLAVAIIVCFIVAILVLLIYRPYAGRSNGKSRSAVSTGHTAVRESGEMDTLPTNNV